MRTIRSTIVRMRFAAASATSSFCLTSGSACPNGSTFAAPDKRLKDVEGRVYSLEGWANQAGHFGTPPAQGVTDESGTFDTLRQRGDA